MRLLRYAVLVLGAWVATFLLLSGPYPRPDEGPQGVTTTAFRQLPDGGTVLGCRTLSWERENWGAFPFLSLRYETARDQFGLVEPARVTRRVVERTADRAALVATAAALAVVWGCVALLVCRESATEVSGYTGTHSIPSAG